MSKNSCTSSFNQAQNGDVALQCILDKHTEGYNFDISNIGSQYLTNSHSFNNHSIIELPSTSFISRGGAAPLISVNKKRTIFLVIKLAGTPGDLDFFKVVSNLSLGIDTSSYYKIDIDGTSSTTSKRFGSSDIISYTSDGMKHSLYINGKHYLNVQKTINDESGEILIGDISGITLSFASFVMYNRKLSDDERKEVEFYLMHKYGIDSEA